MPIKDTISIVGGVVGIMGGLVGIVTAGYVLLSSYFADRERIKQTIVFVENLKSGEEGGRLHDSGLRKLANDLVPNLEGLAFTSQKLVITIRDNEDVREQIRSAVPNQAWSITPDFSNVFRSESEARFDLGPHDFCALALANEQGIDASQCEIEQVGRRWTIKVSNAICEAVCFRLSRM